MGFLDNAKAKLTDAVDKHGDKIADGLDKAGDAVDKKTGGKHSDKIDTGVAKAKEGLDGLDGKNDDFRPPRPSRLRPRRGALAGTRAGHRPGPAPTRRPGHPHRPDQPGHRLGARP